MSAVHAAESEALIAEARVLFPGFVRDGKVLPDQELAKLKTYGRFLRLGILIWAARGRSGFRELMDAMCDGDPCGKEARLLRLRYLWHGIENGCMPPE